MVVSVVEVTWSFVVKAVYVFESTAFAYQFTVGESSQEVPATVGRAMVMVDAVGVTAAAFML